MFTKHPSVVLKATVDDEAPTLLDARISPTATIDGDGKISMTVPIATADGQLMYNRLLSLIKKNGSDVSIPTGIVAELIEAYRDKSAELKESEAELELVRRENATLSAENLDCHDNYARSIITGAKACVVLKELNSVADEVAQMVTKEKHGSTDKDGAEAFLQLGRMCALTKKLYGIFAEEDSTDTTAE